MDNKDLKSLGTNTQYTFNAPDSDILETFENKSQNAVYLVPFYQTRDEFTSICPVTSQPDHAKMEIVYVPNKLMVESKSLKLYLFSFRNNGEFHEDVVNRISRNLWNLLEPKYLRVFGDFAPRGGIAIAPINERWERRDCQDPTITKQIERLVNIWDTKHAK